MKTRIWAFYMLLGMLSMITAVHAGEPVNNTAPWTGARNNDLSVYWTWQAEEQWANVEQIYPSTDKDYIVLNCQKTREKIKTAAIFYYHPQGDVDLKVYRMAGDMLAYRGGVDGMEWVDMRPFNESSAVLFVYGYGGATNAYTVFVECEPR